MAAPDRVYRYFTNLKAKNHTQNGDDIFYVRCAKPLSTYISQSSQDSALEQVKKKFKIDGILWVKNPDTPHQATDPDITVDIEIEDPENPGQTITIQIDDPDLGDSNRDGFISYVYPHGENAAFHDIRGYDGTPISNNGGNNNNYGATDYSNRSWSRASKFRYKDSDDAEAAVILNDAGLNRRGDAEIDDTSIGPYIYAPLISTFPSLNDIKVVCDFYSAPYNRLYASKLEIAKVNRIDTIDGEQVPIYDQFVEIGNAGIVPRIGPSGSVDLPTLTVKFIGKENPAITETDITSLIYADDSLITITYQGTGTISGGSSFSITLPQYGFRALASSEEGDVYSDVVGPIDISLFRWNTIDAITPDTSPRQPNNANIDRVSVSHATPEKALERYNDLECFASNQIPTSGGLSMDTDPDPDSGISNVKLIYTPFSDLTYSGDPAGRPTGLSKSNLVFFYNDNESNWVYYPLLPWEYVTAASGSAKKTTERSFMYLTMRCRLKDTTTGSNEFIEGVYCIEYTMYPHNFFSQITMDDDYPALSRYWEMAYDDTLNEWYWPKSRYNKNVSIDLHYNADAYSSGLRPDVTCLATNTYYYLSSRVAHINTGELYNLSVINNTVGAALLYPKNSDTPIATSIIGGITKQSWSTDAPGVPSENTNFSWFNDFLRIKRESNANWYDISTVVITVTYKSYTTMINEGQTESKTYTLETLGVDPNGHITGFVRLSHYSNITDYSSGTQININTLKTGGATALDAGNTVIRYTGGGKMYTDYLASAVADQHYYYENYRVESGVAHCDAIYYVDSTGDFAKLSTNF